MFIEEELEKSDKFVPKWKADLIRNALNKDLIIGRPPKDAEEEVKRPGAGSKNKKMQKQK